MTVVLRTPCNEAPALITDKKGWQPDLAGEAGRARRRTVMSDEVQSDVRSTARSIVDAETAVAAEESGVTLTVQPGVVEGLITRSLVSYATTILATDVEAFANHAGRDTVTCALPQPPPPHPRPPDKFGRFSALGLPPAPLAERALPPLRRRAADVQLAVRRLNGGREHLDAFLQQRQSQQSTE